MDLLARWRGSKLGLRSHLLVFGLAIVVPVLLYSAFLLHRYTEYVRTSNERRALEIARSLTADIDREITAVITILQTLASSEALATRDFSSFYVQVKEALRSRPWNVVLIDANRRQLINTRLPWGTPLPVSASEEPDFARFTKDKEAYVVSDLFIGTITKRPIFSVAVPVQIGRGIPYALVMSLEPERLVEVLQSQNLPEGWLAAVSDSKNINMARTRLAERYLGQPIPEESVRQYGGRQEGVIATSDLEGKRAIHAFHFSKLTKWRVATWAPASVVEDQLHQAWTLFLWSGAALLSLSLLLAFGIGRLMAAPIGALMRAASDLGQGKPVAPIASTLREADELSVVLSEAARELAARMRAEAHLAAIVSSSPSAILSLSPEGLIRSWNEAATQLFGYTAEEVVGRPADIIAPENARDTFENLYARAHAGATVHADVVRQHKDGSLIDVSVNVAPMYDDAGRLVGISSISRDVGERKARERQIEFLLRELAHRSKNLLAVVQAIAGQTARSSPNLQAFQRRFSERIAAMARSHDLLVARDWKGTPVSELVQAQLAPFADAGSARISASGPAIELRPEAVQSLTLALHELATNAAKYGALSVPEGRVTIAWEVSGSIDRERRFRMHWRESDGPAVSEPERKGFGHLVISDMVGRSLLGKVALEFAPDGLSWSVDAPASAVVQALPTAVPQPA